MIAGRDCESGLLENKKETQNKPLYLQTSHNIILAQNFDFFTDFITFCKFYAFSRTDRYIFIPYIYIIGHLNSKKTNPPFIVFCNFQFLTYIVERQIK